MMTVAAGAMAASSGMAAAQAADAPAAAERSSAPADIIVTARKRAESLQEAPVAITAISSEKLIDNNLTSLTDVASIAGGGVIIAQAGVTTTLSIRGVSSDSTNTGFDQTVGIVIDGVFYDRGRWLNQGFMDMAQVEILKGPQALYFGRSAVAGAINITTAGPGDEFEASVTGGYEFDGQEIYGEGFISGPLSETFGARLAVRASDSKGPWNNLSTSLPDKSFGATNEISGRLTLEWEPTSDFEANLKLQAGRLKDDGIAVYSQLFNCKGPSTTNVDEITGIPGVVGIEPYKVNDDCKLNRKINVDKAPPGVDFPDPFSKLTSEAATLRLTYRGDGFDLTSITGYNHYKYGYATGLISSGGLITASEGETNRAITQELRVDTDFDGPANFLFGGNFQDARFTHDNANQLFVPPPDPVDGRNISHSHYSIQNGTSWSIFGELSLDVTPQIELAAGARYSKEVKNSTYVIDYVNPGQAFIFLPEGTVISDNFNDDAVSPQITLTYKPDSDLTIYGSYRTGFLPGGFSHGGTPQAGLTSDGFKFDSEKAKGFEAGIKSAWFDRTLTANLTAYSYKYTNLQVSIYLPATAAFITGNAGEARTRGVEAELNWQATPEFSLRGFANYNDGKFRDSRGPCYSGQSEAQGCSPVSFDQDLSGKPLPRAPKWTLAAGAHYRQPIGNLVMSIGADLNYSGDYQLEPTNDPELVQNSFVRLDANIGLETADGRWKASLIGRNLTDQSIGVFGATRGFTNDSLMVLQRFREVRLQLAYRY
jgi:outer membrane receptor protein involved in Fe transport